LICSSGFGLIVHLLIFHKDPTGALRRYRCSASHEISQAIFCIAGLQKPRSSSVLILCAYGRAIEATQASNHSIVIRRQTGNVHWRFGIQMVCLSKERSGWQAHRQTRQDQHPATIDHVAVELGQSLGRRLRLKSLRRASHEA